MLCTLLVPLTLLAPESPPELAPAAERAAAVLRSIEGLTLATAPPRAISGTTSADLRAALDRSRDAFRTLALDDAIREATTVVERAPAVDAAPVENARLLREAFVRIAIAHQTAGRVDAGREAFARAAGVGLREPLPLTDFSPPVVESYEREWERLLALPPAKIRIDVDPAGSRILVDGLPVTRSANGEIEVLPTAHLVSAEYAGRGMVTERIDAGATEVRLVVPQPELGPGTARLSITGQPAGDLMLHLDVILPDDQGGIGMGEPATAADIEVAARRLGEGLRDRLSPRSQTAATFHPATSRQTGPTRAGSSAFYERWWFWTAVGVGIVAGVAVTSQAVGDPPSDVYVPR